MNIGLVIPDWGSALGLDWARQHAQRVSGIVLMEFITSVPSWDAMGENEDVKKLFQAFRGPEGRKLLIEENAFIEIVLPMAVVRKLSEEEMDAYRAPFLEKESREPVYRWPKGTAGGGTVGAGSMKNLETVFIGPGVHYVQEDNPAAMGEGIAKWLNE